LTVCAVIGMGADIFNRSAMNAASTSAAPDARVS